MIKRMAWIAAAALAAGQSPALAQDVCRPAWRTVDDAIAGATYEMAAPPRRSYFIAYGDNFPSTTYEQDFLAEVGCATFSAAVWDLGDQVVSDPQGLFDQLQADATSFGDNNKLHWSRARTVDGFPAREYLTSLNVDYTGDHVYYRTLVVARGNQILSFNSHWDGGDTSPIADRLFRSIHVRAGTPNPNLRSFALLSEAITKYWMFPSASYKYTDYFTPALIADIEKNRARDKAAIEAFGYPRTFTFMKSVPGGKVVRVAHDDATVDWTLYDNGTVLTGIWYRKVSDTGAGG